MRTKKRAPFCCKNAPKNLLSFFVDLANFCFLKKFINIVNDVGDFFKNRKNGRNSIDFSTNWLVFGIYKTKNA